VDRRIRILAIVLLVIYAALFLQLNRLQVFDAEAYNDRPDNNRPVEADFNRPRGTISTIDGKLLAFSEETGVGRYVFQRRYPSGQLFAHVTGSYSFLFGATGAEREYNDELSGRTPELELRSFSNPFTDTSAAGNLVLSLRNDVQEVARAQLGERKGSVVAIDPRTGGLLALWSYPSYDPNFTSSNDPTLARASRELLQANPDKPLLAKSYRDRFFPGSTFKVVTAAGGLESGRVAATEPVFPVTSAYTPPLTSRPITNFGGSSCGGDLINILRVSCNTAFAEMGAEILGPEIMIGESEDFGFNAVPPIDLPRAVESVFPTDFGAIVETTPDPNRADIYENTPGLALAAIGQFDVAATPLQMALIAGAVANGGAAMTPHILDRVDDSNGTTVESYESNVWLNAITQSSASTLRQAMLEVVASGTARRAAIPGMEVGAKTGTAQLGADVDATHAWMIGFAGPPGGSPEVAVAVIVEGGPGTGEQTGGVVSAPIAKAVMEAALAPIG
jgi:peptidoglycan glycosyltransferase